MNVLLDNFPAFRDGFIGTLSITLFSSAIALVLGIVIAGFRVSPSRHCAISGRLGSRCCVTLRSLCSS